MATFAANLIPTSPTAATLFNGTVASGATVLITLAYRTSFAVVTSQQCSIRFGNQLKSPTATSADWPMFANATSVWETGEEMDRFSIFNNSGSTATYWVYCLSRT